MRMRNAKDIQCSDAVAVLVSGTGGRDVVKPIIGDKLIPVGLAHREMAGGELGRRHAGRERPGSARARNRRDLHGVGPRRGSDVLLRAQGGR